MVRTVVPDITADRGAGHHRSGPDGPLLARGLLSPSVHGPRIARAPRRDDSVNHCTWRSHGHALVLDCDDARRYFLSLLRKYKGKHGIEVHSYCLMGSHPHLVCRATRGQAAFSQFWKVVNWFFARWYNRRTGGRGQVVMERLRSPRIQDGRHQLTVMRYGDLNPVRAGLVSSARAWKWSSHRHYAYGDRDELITDAPEYLALGATAPRRRKAYLALFARPLLEKLLRKRRDLVELPFIGEARWLARRYAACGLSPPEPALLRA